MYEGACLPWLAATRPKKVLLDSCGWAHLDGNFGFYVTAVFGLYRSVLLMLVVLLIPRTEIGKGVAGGEALFLCSSLGRRS